MYMMDTGHNNERKQATPECAQLQMLSFCKDKLLQLEVFAEVAILQLLSDTSEIVTIFFPSSFTDCQPDVVGFV